MAKRVTIGVTILFAILVVLSLFTIITEKERGIPICIIAILLAIYFIVFAFRPISYKLTDDKVIIHRIFSNVKIYRRQITNIQLFDKANLNGTIRTFAVGGIFGYYGKFLNKQFGKMTWYATRLDKAILVQTIDHRNIILTPNEPEKFIADYHKPI